MASAKGKAALVWLNFEMIVFAVFVPSTTVFARFNFNLGSIFKFNDHGFDILIFKLCRLDCRQLGDFLDRFSNKIHGKFLSLWGEWLTKHNFYFITDIQWSKGNFRVKLIWQVWRW